MPELDKLCTRIGYQFKDYELLQLAVTHRSYSGKNNNERLEFLGDSILNFVVGKALFDQFPAGKEGQLSRLRANLVQGVTLAEVGKQLELSQCLLLGAGELKTGGSRRESIIADAVEAIIGAVFQEAGFDVCRTMVLNWFAPRMAKLALSDTVKDNKTRLQEYLQGEKLPLPLYEITAVTGESHSQSFVVQCVIEGLTDTFMGSGPNRRRAEQQAAGKALATLLSDQ